MVIHDLQGATYQKVSKIKKAIFGGISGMVATTIVHPLDVVKVRMQVYPSNENSFQLTRKLLRCEGVSSLYSGLTAALMRQATYTTTRLGVYHWLYEEYKQTYGKIPILTDKVLIGILAGLVGAFAGNPSDMVLVRMMADGKRNRCRYPECKHKRRYRNVFDAFYKIICSEGFCALWRGGMLTLSRSVIVSVSQIATHGKVSEALKERKLAEGATLHLYSSVISSFVTALLTLPVDHVKTNYQVVKGSVVTQRELFEEIIKTDGFGFFWKEFIPYYVRLSLQTVLTYIILEEIIQMYVNYKHFPGPKKQE